MPVASPELTGAAGPTYESQVSALYLADLLMEAGVRPLEDAISQRVQLQRKAFGAPLDDIVVVGRRRDGREGQLHLQAKHTLTLSAAASNTDFREIVHAAWDTFTASAFERDVHRIGGVTEHVSFKKLRAATDLHRAARNAHDATELRARIDVPGLIGKPAHDVYSAVRTLIEEQAERPPTDEELFQFWRHFVILRIETSAEGARDRHDAIERLRQYLPHTEIDRSVDLLNALERVARDIAKSAGSVDRNTLLGLLDGRFVIRNLDDGPHDKLELLTATGRTCAAHDLDAFRNVRPHPLLIRIGLEDNTEAEARSIDEDQLIAFLGSREDVMLEAPPGAGKSTTLLQFAEGILSGTADRVPIVVLLSEFALGHRGILEEIAQRAAFNDVGVDRLRRLAGVGRLVLLMDGWNELAPEQRARVHAELSKFKRDYHNNPWLVATRRQANTLTVIGSNLRPQHRVSLQPLSEAQQLYLLSSELGRDATDLYDRAIRISGLRDILGTPLYVRVLAEVAAKGTLPATREELIRRSVETSEQVPTHREGLNQIFFDSHRRVLQRVATYLTERQTTTILEPDLRFEVSSAARALLAAGRNTQLEPQRAIDALVAHHILVEGTASDNKRLFGFQHQQFQEWFASLEIEDRMQSAAAMQPGDAMQGVDEVLNDSSWEEAVLFAAERLSRQAGAAKVQVARLILRALGIDPMLAAGIIQRSTAEVWALIAEPILQFTDAWSGGGQEDRALAFMLATGRPEFADRVWRLFEDQNLYRRAVRDQCRIVPATLGADVRLRVEKLTPSRRTELLWDLVDHGEQEGIDLAFDLARTETSAEVVVGFLEALEFLGANRQLAELLEEAQDEVWHLLARRLPLENLPEELAERLHGEKVRLIASLPPGVERLRLRLQLYELSASAEDPQELISEALNTELHPDARHFSFELFSRLATQHPDLLSEGIVARIIHRQSVPLEAWKYVRSASALEQPVLLEIILDPKTGNTLRQLAALALDTSSVYSLIHEHLERCKSFFGLAGDNRTQIYGGSLEELRARHMTTSNALQYPPVEALSEAIVKVEANDPVSIGVCAEVIFRWIGNDTGYGTLPLPTDLGEHLSERVRTWGAHIIASPDALRSQLSALATVIRRIGRPNLLPQLKSLLDRDLALSREQRARRDEAWKRGEYNTERDSEASMSFTPTYRKAFEAFDAELVRDTLLGYLDDADFSTEAAFALIGSGGREKVSQTADWFMHTETELRVPSREEGTTSPAMNSGPAHPVAMAVLDRVDRLIATDGPSEISRAISLATAAAQMDFGDRWATFETVLTKPGQASARYALISCLLRAGWPIRPEWIAGGLNDALTRITVESWRSDHEWWNVERWFELAAVKLASKSLMEFVRRIPLQLKQNYRLRSFIRALGRSGATDALETLAALADDIPELVREEYWVDSIVHVGSIEAAQLLVRMAFGDQGSGALLNAIVVPDSLAELLRRFPSVRNDLLTRLHNPHPDNSRAIAARLLSTVPDQEFVLSVLDVVRLDRPDPLRTAVLRAVEELATFKRRIDATSGAYRTEPAELEALRARLFEVVRSGGPYAHFAAQLLITIDRSRDIHGRPLGEPRHPDLLSKTPWPLEAQVAWTALTSLTG